MDKAKYEISGRKIFFLYPQSAVLENMLPQLSIHEYEVYVLSDHEKARAVLRANQDSILFINIDTILSPDAWKEYVRSCFSDNSLKSTLFGVITNNGDPAVKKYYTDFGVQCGVISIRKGVEESLKQITAVLEEKKAKGLRKYVRVNCENDTMASINFMESGIRRQMKLRDISSVGFSSFFKEEVDYLPSQNTIIRDIQLTLRGTLIRCNAVVYGVKEIEGHKVYVMLFTKEMEPITKSKIQTYIRNYLQSIVDAIK
ncbi:MAG: hypothetical protein LBU99_07475 [Spirochaetaceae bacterium]|nr:hypothetical protein [Spirochaetaceae bacterium]